MSYSRFHRGFRSKMDKKVTKKLLADHNFVSNFLKQIETSVDVWVFMSNWNGLYLGCFVLFFLKNSELYLGCFVLFWYFFSKEISQKSAAFKGKPQKFLHFLTQKIGSIPGVYCPAEDRTIQTDTYRILSRFSTFLKRILSKSWIFF